MENKSGFGEFSSQVQSDITGLAYLGKLEEEFTWAGHRFVIRTLTVKEELEAGVIVKEYDDTIAQAKALTAVAVAASLVSVDGKPLVQQLGPQLERDEIREKYHYITSNWYWPTIQAIGVEYAKLFERMSEAVEAVEKKFETGRTSTSRFSSESLTEKESSPEDP
jgi:hypothetical protein